MGERGGPRPRDSILRRGRVDGKSLAEILIREGLARSKGVAPNLPSGEKARAYMERLDALEQDARAKRVGAWSTAAEEKKETNREQD
jgi:endonuclease YncB( thermonuclease family)